MVFVSRIYRYYQEEGLDKLPNSFLITSEIVCGNGDLYTLTIILEIYVTDKKNFDPVSLDRFIPDFLLDCEPKIMYHDLSLDYNLDEIKRHNYLSYESVYNELLNEKPRYLKFLRKAVLKKLRVDRVPKNILSEVIGWDIVMIRTEEHAVLNMRVFGDYNHLIVFMERLPKEIRDKYMYLILKPNKISEIIYNAPEADDDFHYFRIYLE